MKNFITDEDKSDPQVNSLIDDILEVRPNHERPRWLACFWISIERRNGKPVEQCKSEWIRDMGGVIHVTI